MVMDTIQQILSDYGIELDQEYTDLSEKERSLITERMWKMLYEEHYLSLDPAGRMKQELIIHHILHSMLEKYERLEEYEVCLLIKDLIDTTNKKINELDDALNNEKTE